MEINQMDTSSTLTRNKSVGQMPLPCYGPADIASQAIAIDSNKGTVKRKRQRSASPTTVPVHEQNRIQSFQEIGFYQID
ncbi:hypothetical protein H6P81_003062 [Aristolochia fimbriata]|uniref:Uncharacterized protein n=1 Tax=Aristolochia fimbriata TaxID=158543 RepID=A0AAV7FD75_ARIFI|nr:hypothetical protein H6P81_003062 [Aristolochia fimbriata]